MSDEAMWRKRVAEWRASGLASTTFTDGRGYSASALRYWNKRLEKAAATVATAPVRIARLVRDDVSTSDREDASVISIEVGRARLTVGRDFDRATLRSVLEVMAELELGTTR